MVAILNRLKAERWRLLILISTLSILAVAAQGLSTVYHLESSNRQLVEHTLPLFETVQAVRNRLNEQEVLFYQYYLEGQSPGFINTMTETHTQNLRDLERIAEVIGSIPSLTALKTAIQHLHEISIRFDSAMTTPTNWDEARDVLTEFTPVAEQVSRDSLMLLVTINDGIKRGASTGLNETGQSLLWIGFMSLMLFITAIILYFTNEKLMQAVKIQKRLASFPACNPNPVLALNEQGEILYANAGAQNLAKALFNLSEPERILPTDVESLIRRAQHYHGNVELDYFIADRAYRAELHWLHELNESHIYLADVTAQKQAHQQLTHMAYHHSLTDLPNRKQLEHSYTHQLAESLVLLEIDRYQQIITSSGHEVAEQVIKQIAKRIRMLSSDSKLVLFHIESNVFAMLVENNSDVKRLIKTLCGMMHTPIEVGERHYYVSISAGSVRISPEDNLYEAMRKADSALRMVTIKGGDGFRQFDKVLDKEYLHRTALQNDLRHAITHNELMIYLQPIHAAETGKLVAAEALLRWYRRHNEWVSPIEFVPIAENSGLIVPIEQWVIEQVFTLAGQLLKNRSEPLNLAINISAIHWEYDHLCEDLKERLERHQLDASLFTLEITEQLALQSPEKNLQTMATLKAMGFKLALDDFGTGFSSLNYLHRLPVDKLKIDQSFVRQLEDGGKNTAIVRSVVELAHQLEIQVVAEGVENEPQRAALADWGCDYMQGYLFAKPLSVAEFIRVSTH